MGAFLDKPKTEKTEKNGEGSDLRYGASAMQGWRLEMEDADVCCVDLPLKGWSFFGVFDGHAGPKASLHCSKYLLNSILECLEKDKEDYPPEQGEYPVEKVKKAMTHGFLAIDKKMQSETPWNSGEDHSGSTAIVVLISPTHIFWANCGDSRGIFCTDEGLAFATADHKPSNELEKKRIEKAGGTVMMQRVNGSLAVSRALGDYDYKKNPKLNPVEQLVSPEPDVTVIERNEKDMFLLLACDGIYDVMSNTDVLKYVLHQLRLEKDLSTICSGLIDTCLLKNSRDNMSVVLVTFPGAPKFSHEAVKKEEESRKKVLDEIQKRLEIMVDSANDPLEVEENYVFQTLMNTREDSEFSITVAGQKEFIISKLQSLTEEKFGTGTATGTRADFTGPSDSSEAPAEFQINTAHGPVHVLGMMSEGTNESYDEALVESQHSGGDEDDSMEIGTQEDQSQVTSPGNNDQSTSDAVDTT